MIDLGQQLREISAALDGAGIRAALIGGLAYSVYVEPRATEDIDFLIAAPDWARASATLAPLGWRELSADMDFGETRIRRLTKIIGNEHAVCDFLLAGAEAAEAMAKRNTIVLDGVAVHLAAPETIIALKRARNSPKDRADIDGLERRLRGE